MSMHNNRSEIVTFEQKYKLLLTKISAELPTLRELVAGATIPTIVQPFLPESLKSSKVALTAVRDVITSFLEIVYVYTNTTCANTNYTYDWYRVTSKLVKGFTKLGAGVVAILKKQEPNLYMQEVQWPSNVAGASLIEISKNIQNNVTIAPKDVVINAIPSGSSETFTVNLALVFIEILQVNRLTAGFQTIVEPYVGNRGAFIASSSVNAFITSGIIAVTVRTAKVVIKEYVPEPALVAKIDATVNIYSAISFLGTRISPHYHLYAPIYAVGTSLLVDQLIQGDQTTEAESASYPITTGVLVYGCAILTSNLPIYMRGAICTIGIAVTQPYINNKIATIKSHADQFISNNVNNFYPDTTDNKHDVKSCLHDITRCINHTPTEHCITLGIVALTTTHENGNITIMDIKTPYHTEQCMVGETEDLVATFKQIV